MGLISHRTHGSEATRKTGFIRTHRVRRLSPRRCAPSDMSQWIQAGSAQRLASGKSSVGGVAAGPDYESLSANWATLRPPPARDLDMTGPTSLVCQIECASILRIHELAHSLGGDRVLNVAPLRERYDHLPAAVPLANSENATRGWITMRQGRGRFIPVRASAFI